MRTLDPGISTSPEVELCQPTVMDLFSGCGGMSLGFKQAGFQPVLAADIDPDANREYTRNVGLVPQHLDLFDIDGPVLLELAGLDQGQLDVLVGCPPCQGFTWLRSRSKEYTTNSLVPKMAKIAAEMLPKYVILENVVGMLTYGAVQFGKYVERLARADYSTVYGIVRAADYGVPQHRERVIAISTQHDGHETRLTLPAPTHANPANARALGLSPWTTVRGAIADLPALESGESASSPRNHSASCHSEKVLKIVRAVPHDGGSRRSIPRRFWLDCHKKLKRGAENVYGRMWWDRPGPTVSSRCTVPACGRFTHPEQDRGMTLREALRLQSFPDSYVFSVTTNKAARFLGNAMPVLLARRLAEHVKQMLYAEWGMAACS